MISECDTRIRGLRYKKEVRSSYMKHDGHFQPYAYGITAVEQKSIKSRSGERVERERERVGEEEGFRSLG